MKNMNPVCVGYITYLTAIHRSFQLLQYFGMINNLYLFYVTHYLVLIFQQFSESLLLINYTYMKLKPSYTSVEQRCQTSLRSSFFSMNIIHKRLPNVLNKKRLLLSLNMVSVQEAIWDKQASVAQEMYLRLSKILHHHQFNYMKIFLFNFQCLSLTKWQKCYIGQRKIL